MALGVRSTSFHCSAADSVAWRDVLSLPTKQLSPSHSSSWGWEEDVDNKASALFPLSLAASHSGCFVG